MNEKYASWKVLLDCLFILAIAYTMMFAVALTAMNPKVPPSQGPERKAEFLIQMDWPHSSHDDIDLWVLLPDFKTVSFRGKDVDGVTLDRDDLGISNDLYITGDDGKIKAIRFNRETVAIRGIYSGRFVVNVQVFSDKSSQYATDEVQKLPYPVEVKLIKINPTVTEIVTRRVDVEQMGQQKTAFSFTVTPEGKVVDLDVEEQLPFIAIGGMQ